MSAQIRIEGAKLPKVLQVPVGAAVRIERGTFCYVLSGKAIQSRTVTLGARNAQNVEIKEGLIEGEEVLCSPLDGKERPQTPEEGRTSPLADRRRGSKLGVVAWRDPG